MSDELWWPLYPSKNNLSSQIHTQYQLHCYTLTDILMDNASHENHLSSKYISVVIRRAIIHYKGVVKTPSMECEPVTPALLFACVTLPDDMRASHRPAVRFMSNEVDSSVCTCGRFVCPNPAHKCCGRTRLSRPRRLTTPRPTHLLSGRIR